MRGTATLHSTVGRLFVLGVAAASLCTVASPASAHQPGNHLSARRHTKERAMSMIGKPYRYAQESPRRGFDCSGLTYWTFKEHADPNIARSSSDQWRMRKRRGYKRVWERRNLKKGDLVFFDTGSGAVGHVGIYIGRERFVHSSSSRGGVRTDSMLDKYYWKPRYVGAVRVPAHRGIFDH
jgi:cell wall-associated NlpC family hydrolase